jgi:hypothetical protein
MNCAAALGCPKSPKGLPKLRSSQSSKQNSEHLAELKPRANNSDDLKSARCKAVYTGSIPVVAFVLAANRWLLVSVQSPRP